MSYHNQRRSFRKFFKQHVFRHFHGHDAPESNHDTINIEAAKRANEAAYHKNAELEKPNGRKTSNSVAKAHSDTSPTSQNQKSNLYEMSPLAKFSAEICPPVGQSAYETALTNLDDNSRRALSEGKSIRTLLEQLDETDHRQQSEKWLQRGQAKVGIEYVQRACEYLDLFTCFIPAPGMSAALSLIKGTLTVCIRLLPNSLMDEELTGVSAIGKNRS